MQKMNSYCKRDHLAFLFHGFQVVITGRHAEPESHHNKVVLASWHSKNILHSLVKNHALIVWIIPLSPLISVCLVSDYIYVSRISNSILFKVQRSQGLRAWNQTVGSIDCLVSKVFTVSEPLLLCKRFSELTMVDNNGCTVLHQHILHEQLHSHCVYTVDRHARSSRGSGKYNHHMYHQHILEATGWSCWPSHQGRSSDL